MKLKAKDTIHVSSVQAEPIRAGAAFEVGDAEGQQLVDRGLAAKIAAAPKNKMAKAPANKSATKRRR